MSAFAVAEQLGLALSIPEILDVTFPVIKQKSTDQLLLQKCALEMCSISILYKKTILTLFQRLQNIVQYIILVLEAN